VFVRSTPRAIVSDDYKCGLSRIQIEFKSWVQISNRSPGLDIAQLRKCRQQLLRAVNGVLCHGAALHARQVSLQRSLAG